MELIGAGRPWRVGVIDDRLVGHEQSNDIGQLAWVREIDGVSRAIDHDEEAVVFGLTGHLVDARRARHQRVAGSGDNQRWLVQSEQPVQRWILREVGTAEVSERQIADSPDCDAAVDWFPQPSY